MGAIGDFLGTTTGIASLLVLIIAVLLVIIHYVSRDVDTTNWPTGTLDDDHHQRDRSPLPKPPDHGEDDTVLMEKGAAPSRKEIDDAFETQSRSSRSAREAEPEAAATDVAVGEEVGEHYEVTVYYATDRRDLGGDQYVSKRFTDERALGARGQSPITFGTCKVSIPKHHVVGELEAPSAFNPFDRNNADKYVILLSIDKKEKGEFFNALRERIGRDSEKQTFVFVHGFGVTFENAARRTAQMAYDLRFSGAPIFYGWPTESFGFLNPDFTAYSESENNARWTTWHFKEFLLDVVQRTGAETVHIIAHSMGNRIVADALLHLRHVMTAQEQGVLREIILTAPDIDADVFVHQIAPEIAQLSSRVTLYASRNDQALKVSKTIHGYRRIGDFHDVTLFPEGVDTIDASEVETDSIGHNYYGANESVISDICQILNGGAMADKRLSTLVSRTATSGAKYWRVKKGVKLGDVWDDLWGA